jgi:hypothetical protein
VGLCAKHAEHQRQLWCSRYSQPSSAITASQRQCPSPPHLAADAATACDYAEHALRACL